MDQRLKLDPVERETVIGDIINYFLTERNEEIGNLAAGFILEFFSEKLGPFYYNLGVRDAHAFLSDKLEDLSSLEIWQKK